MRTALTAEVLKQSTERLTKIAAETPAAAMGPRAEHRLPDP